MLFALVAVLAIAPAAHAGDGYAAGAAWGCNSSFGGQRDAAGRLYVPCNGKVWVLAADGAIAKLVTIDMSVAGTKPVYLVAPTPDGSALYTLAYSNGGSAALGMALQRLKLSADGTTYRLDTSFRPQQYLYAGTRRNVCGRGLAVDAYGNVYVSQGGWCAQTNAAGVLVPDPNLILKYRSSGALVTQFGEYGAGTNAPLGQFNVNMQLDVTADGRRIYVADHLNVRVQYFDWQVDGTYRPAGSFNSVTVNGTVVPFSATYGVALDPWGSVYVADTTQARIWKTSADGTYVAKLVDLDDTKRIHTLSVDGRGFVFSGEQMQYWARDAGNPIPATRPDPGPEPKPDLVAPQLQSVSAPAETIAGTVQVQVAATDDVGVTELRTADENGTWGAWRPYSSSLDVTLTDGVGVKLVYVQVRDVRQQESDVRFAAVARKPIPDVTAPTLRVTAPATTTLARVTLGIESADAIGVTHLRVAGNDGTFSDWQPWSAGVQTMSRELGTTVGTYAIAIQVRDAAFNVSETATVRISFVKPGVPPPPVVDGVTGGGAGGNAVPGGAGILGDDPAADGGGVVVRDLVAPRIYAFKVPARSCSRIVTLRLVAHDDAIPTWVRVANEDGRYGRWQPYRASVRQVLTRGLTRKLVTVQVADAAGNVSRASSRRLLVVRCRR
ncbi:MAG: pknD 3 [Thermoleophilia bacterium]|nr:pknD 3 [Thermoleophilia bacterium]